ncbi:hypothetical protein TrLO_g1069 [Triparma laevis f. longispina]|uniref:WD40 repeat-like protein n=1 Tax=Triparma laevis f. longispina TaxID=1714387 RepID=A0A9W7A452_9STRA|nr:hypothetical protein TrLO_g1069 [Triparma laevis f. longispina]
MLQSSLSAFFTGVKKPLQPTQPDSSNVPKKSKPTKLTKKIEVTDNLTKLWGFKTSKIEEKEVKKEAIVESKKKEKRRVTLTPKTKTVHHDDDYDEEDKESEDEVLPVSKRFRKEPVQEKHVEEVDDKKDDDKEGDEASVYEEEEQEEPSPSVSQEDPQILSLLPTLPPTHTYTTLATLLMRKSIPMYLCGLYWSHYKTLHSIKTKSDDPSPAELAIAKMEKLKAESKGEVVQEGIGEYAQARLDRIARNAAYLKSIGLDSGIVPVKKSENVKKVRTKKKGTKTFTKDVNVGGRSSSRIKGIKPPDYNKETMECSLANTGPIVVEDVNENCVVYGEEDIEKYETADVGKGRKTKCEIGDWWSLATPINSDSAPCLFSVPKPSHFPEKAESSVLLPGVNLKRLYALDFCSGNRLIGWSWRASNKWLSSAYFLPLPTLPLHLLTTANDGVLRLWNLSKLKNSQPLELFKAPNIHNKSGIFSMSVVQENNGVVVATGSKDKTVAVTRIDGKSKVEVIWRGDYHDKIVKNVSFSSQNPNLIGSTSDDGTICISDFRSREAQTSPSITLENAHFKPHSIVFADGGIDKNVFMTAGSCGDVIKLFDIRSPLKPTTSLRGHTFESGAGKRQIHHPNFYSPIRGGPSYVISGGDRTEGISMFEIGKSGGGVKGGEVRASNRGILGEDAGAICVEKDKEGWGFRVAASCGGGVQLLSPKWKKQ